MDRQERHELEQNDLESFFTNFGEFWSKYGNHVLFVVMIAAVTFAGYQYFTTTSRQKHESAWLDLAGATSPEVYREIAGDHDNPTVQALAYLRGGDLLLTQALAPDQPQPAPTPAPGGEAGGDAAPQPEPAKPVDRQKLLQDAASMYEQALGVAKAPLIQFNAHLGAAAAAEAQSKWDDAARHYQAVIDGAGESYPMLKSQAEQRLALLDELKAPLAFAPEPPAPAQPTPPIDTTGPLLQLPNLTPGLDSLTPPAPAPATSTKPAPAEPTPAQ